MHQTNKAFERYFRIGTDDIRRIYQATSENTNVNAIIRHIKKAKQ